MKKKLLCLLLTVAMVISCVSMVTFATEGEEAVLGIAITGSGAQVMLPSGLFQGVATSEGAITPVTFYVANNTDQDITDLSLSYSWGSIIAVHDSCLDADGQVVTQNNTGTATVASHTKMSTETDPGFNARYGAIAAGQIAKITFGLPATCDILNSAGGTTANMYQYGATKDNYQIRFNLKAKPTEGTIALLSEDPALQAGFNALNGKKGTNSSIALATEADLPAAKTVVNADAELGTTEGWVSMSAGNGTLSVVEPGANGSGHAIRLTNSKSSPYAAMGVDLGPAIIKYPFAGYQGGGTGLYRIEFDAKASVESFTGTFNISSMYHAAPSQIKAILGGEETDYMNTYQVVNFVNNSPTKLTDEWQHFTVEYNFTDKYLNELYGAFEHGQANALQMYIRIDASNGGYKTEQTATYDMDNFTITKLETIPGAKLVLTNGDGNGTAYVSNGKGMSGTDYSEGANANTNITLFDGLTFSANEKVKPVWFEIYNATSETINQVSVAQTWGTICKEPGTQTSISGTGVSPTIPAGTAAKVLVMVPKVADVYNGGTLCGANETYQDLGLRINFNKSKDGKSAVKAGEFVFIKTPNEPTVEANLAKMSTNGSTNVQSIAAYAIKNDLPELVEEKAPVAVKSTAKLGANVTIEQTMFSELDFGDQDYKDIEFTVFNDTAATSVKWTLSKSWGQAFYDADTQYDDQNKPVAGSKSLSPTQSKAIGPKKYQTFTLRVYKVSDVLNSGALYVDNASYLELGFRIDNSPAFGEGDFITVTCNEPSVLKYLDKTANFTAVEEVPDKANYTDVDATPTPTAAPTPTPVVDKVLANGDGELGTTKNWSAQHGGTVTNVTEGGNHYLKLAGTKSAYNTIGFDVAPAVIDDPTHGYNGGGAGTYKITFKAKSLTQDELSFGFMLNSKLHWSVDNQISNLGIGEADEDAYRAAHVDAWTGAVGDITMTSEWKEYTITFEVSAKFLASLADLYNTYGKSDAYVVNTRFDAKGSKGSPMSGTAEKLAGYASGTDLYAVDDMQIEKVPDIDGAKIVAKSGMANKCFILTQGGTLFDGLSFGAEETTKAVTFTVINRTSQTIKDVCLSYSWAQDLYEVNTFGTEGAKKISGTALTVNILPGQKKTVTLNVPKVCDAVNGSSVLKANAAFGDLGMRFNLTANATEGEYVLITADDASVSKALSKAVAGEGLKAVEGAWASEFPVDPVNVTADELDSLVYGDALDTITLSASAEDAEGNMVEGQAKWVEGGICPVVDDSETTPFEYIFTPNDLTKFNVVVATTTLVVEPQAGTVAAVQAAFEAALGDKTFTYGDTIADLPTEADGWIIDWKDEDTTPLTVGVNTYGFVATKPNYTEVDDELTIEVAKGKGDVADLQTAFDALQGEYTDATTIGELPTTLDGWAIDWTDDDATTLTVGLNSYEFTASKENYEDLTGTITIMATASSTHEHAYDDTWTADGENGHYHACLNDGCDDTDHKDAGAAYAEHTFVDGVCTACGYKCEHSYEEVEGKFICSKCGMGAVEAGVIIDDALTNNIYVDVDYWMQQLANTLQIGVEELENVQFILRVAGAEEPIVIDAVPGTKQVLTYVVNPGEIANYAEIYITDAIGEEVLVAGTSTADYLKELIAIEEAKGADANEDLIYLCEATLGYGQMVYDLFNEETNDFGEEYVGCFEDRTIYFEQILGDEGTAAVAFNIFDIAFFAENKTTVRLYYDADNMKQNVVISLDDPRFEGKINNGETEVGFIAWVGDENSHGYNVGDPYTYYYSEVVDIDVVDLGVTFKVEYTNELGKTSNFDYSALQCAFDLFKAEVVSLDFFNGLCAYNEAAVAYAFSQVD